MSSRKRLRSCRSGNVYCIACGQVVSDDESYDYRRGTGGEARQRESICGSCYDEYSHLPRDGLEQQLVEIGAGTVDDETFFRRYFERLDD